MQKRSTTTNRKTYTTSVNAVVGTLSNVNYPRGTGFHASRQRLEGNYKRDAEIHLQYQKEKEQKKRLEKLKRYEGVGLLGNKMVDNIGTQLSEEDKKLSLRSARDMAQKSYNFQACSRSIDEIESQRIELEKDQKKRLEKLKQYDGVGLLGNKFIENNGTQLLENNQLPLQAAREMAQHSYNFQASSRSKETSESQSIEFKEVAEPSCTNAKGGYTLGGRKFEKGKGEDHPLLKTLFR